MYFENFQALMHMDGHGVYVWSAVAVAVVALLWLIIAPLAKQRGLLKEISRDIQREQDRQHATNNIPDSVNSKESV